MLTVVRSIATSPAGLDFAWKWPKAFSGGTFHGVTVSALRDSGFPALEVRRSLPWTSPRASVDDAAVGHVASIRAGWAQLQASLAAIDVDALPSVSRSVPRDGELIITQHGDTYRSLPRDQSRAVVAALQELTAAVRAVAPEH